MHVIRDCLGQVDGGVVSIVGGGGKTTLLFRLASELCHDGARVLTTTTTKMFFPSADQCRHTLLTASTAEIVSRAKEDLHDGGHLWAASHRLPEIPHKVVGFAPAAVDRLARSHAFRWILIEADGANHRLLKAPEVHEPVIPRSTSVVMAVVGLGAIGRPLDIQWVYRPERYAAVSGLGLGRPVTPASVAAAAAHPEGLFKNSPSHARKMLFLNTAGNRSTEAAGEEIVDHIRQVSGHAGIHGMVLGCPLEAHPVVAYHPMQS